MIFHKNWRSFKKGKRFLVHLNSSALIGLSGNLESLEKSGNFYLKHGNSSALLKLVAREKCESPNAGQCVTEINNIFTFRKSK